MKTSLILHAAYVFCCLVGHLVLVEKERKKNELMLLNRKDFDILWTRQECLIILHHENGNQRSAESSHPT